MQTYIVRISRLSTWKRLKIIGIILSLSFLVFCSAPARAANQIDRKLEEQVLQIIREHPKAIVESVQAYQYQQKQQAQQAQKAFLNEIKTNPKAVIGESPTTGATNAKLLLVEFSDFQCPYCNEAHKTVKQFMAKHQDEVTLVYKHLPLAAIHPEAIPAASAAWAADRQGKFWDYHDELFANQEKLGEAFYQEIAQNLNLDLEKFNRDRALAAPAIQKDMQLATKIGLSGTPFFIMNGQAVAGAVQLEDLENIWAGVNQS